MKRAFLRTLRGPARNRHLTAAQLRSMSTGAWWLMRGFYIVAFLMTFDLLRRSVGIGKSGRDVEPLWPVFWVDWTGLQLGANLIGVLGVAASLAAVLLPTWRSPRVATFLGLLFYGALDNSFGSINHYMHYPIWISAVLIFMPRSEPPAAGASPTLHYFYAFPVFAAQAFIGLFYTMSGWKKLEHAIPNGPEGVSSIGPEALPLLATGRWDRTGIEPMMAQFFVDNMWIGWPAYLLVIYFETVFLIAVFRPSLHKLFGFALASFHVGVYMVMGITFPYQAVLVALLFVMSPFAGLPLPSFRQTIAQLPVLAGLLAFADRSKAKREKASTRSAA